MQKQTLNNNLDERTYKRVADFDGKKLVKFLLLKKARLYFERTKKEPTLEALATYLSLGYRIPISKGKRLILSESEIYHELCTLLGTKGDVK